MNFIAWQKRSKIRLENETEFADFNEAFRNLKNATTHSILFLNVDMSLPYGLTEDFTLIQITLAIFSRKRKLHNTDSFYSHPSVQVRNPYNRP